MGTTKIFWSWQSDRPERETRDIIREAITRAIATIAAEVADADRPEIDHDTDGVAGSPDIVATILGKIENAAVFIADVTPITVGETDAQGNRGKQVANPNVLIELGYAKRAIGPERIITVWNTAFTGARPEDLPFDMRHRRGPIAFDLPEGAPTAAYRDARTFLEKRLETAIRACLATIPAQPAPAPLWQPHFAHEPSIWSEGSGPITVNRGSEGSTKIGLDLLPRGYARLLPSVWNAKPDALTIFENQHPTPLGRFNGLDWGAARGGFLAYRSSEPIVARGSTPSAVRWFRDTGELWSPASSFFTAHNGAVVLSTSYALERWTDWLRHNIAVCRAVGGEGPFHIKLGLDGMNGSSWPQRGYGHDPRTEALDNAVEYDGVLADGSDAEIEQAVRATFALVCGAYGFAPPDDSEYFHIRSR